MRWRHWFRRLPRIVEKWKIKLQNFSILRYYFTICATYTCLRCDKLFETAFDSLSIKKPLPIIFNWIPFCHVHTFLDFCQKSGQKLRSIEVKTGKKMARVWTFSVLRYPCNACGSACGSNYQCRDGSCVPQSWRCDGSTDCSTGEDEIGCRE